MAADNTAPKQETPKQEAQKGNARIPVKKIWLREGEHLGLPGGNGIASIIDCTPAISPGRQFFVAHFVPAHQVIELEWYKTSADEPYRTRVPIGIVQRFD